MSTADFDNLPDIQSIVPIHIQKINWVGVNNIPYNLKIRVSDDKVYLCNSYVSMGVDLKSDQKGIHMSRLVETLNSFNNEINMITLKDLLKELINRQSSSSSKIKFAFDYFKDISTPISKISSTIVYKCEVGGKLQDNILTYFLKIQIPVMSVCPCSNAMCKNGAHSQRVLINVEIINSDIFFDDLIRICSKLGSSSVYTLLKREDEKYVTEIAYDNPLFVEDIVREAQYYLTNNNIHNYYINVESLESIHNHNAYAIISNP